MITYADMLGLFDAHVVAGRHYAIRTRTAAALTPEVVAALFDAGQHQTSALSAVSVHHFHGAASRVPLEATAFGIRRPHYMIEIIAAWEPDDDQSAHLAWADRVATDLAPHALPGGYPNLLGPADAEQIAHAYGANRFAKYGAVRLCFARASFLGGPAATTRPPSLPAPGPRSITQSAPATIRMSCSATTTVLPASTRRCS